MDKPVHNSHILLYHAMLSNFLSLPNPVNLRLTSLPVAILAFPLTLRELWISLQVFYETQLKFIEFLENLVNP